MRRRGFTLIEVIAVILLIGLLTVFLVPTIVNQMGNKQNEINSITEDIIYSAANIYIEQHDVNIQGTYCDIKLQTLIDAGLLDKSSVTYTSGDIIPTNRIIKVTLNSYNQYEYEIVKSCS